MIYSHMAVTADFDLDLTELTIDDIQIGDNAADSSYTCLSCQAHTRYLVCDMPDCKAALCVPCMEFYVIDHIMEEKSFPVCPSLSCPGMLFYSSVKLMTEEKCTLYKKYLLDIYAKNKNDLTVLIKSKQDMMRNMISRRKDFIQRAAPKSVYKCATIIAPSQLNKVTAIAASEINYISERIMVVAEQRDTRKLHEICRNLLCPGKLNNDLVCDVCNIEVCRYCDAVKSSSRTRSGKKYNDGSKHVCKPENVEAMKTIRDKFCICPHCQAYVERSADCLTITCICGGNFQYTPGHVGKKCIEGNHGKTKKVEIKRDFESLFDLFPAQMESMDLVMHNIIATAESSVRSIRNVKALYDPPLSDRLVGFLEEYIKANCDINSVTGQFLEEFAHEFHNVHIKNMNLIYKIQFLQNISNSIIEGVGIDDISKSFDQLSVEIKKIFTH